MQLRNTAEMDQTTLCPARRRQHGGEIRRREPLRGRPALLHGRRGNPCEVRIKTNGRSRRPIPWPATPMYMPGFSNRAPPPFFELYCT